MDGQANRGKKRRRRGRGRLSQGQQQEQPPVLATPEPQPSLAASSTSSTQPLPSGAGQLLTQQMESLSVGEASTSASGDHRSSSRRYAFESEKSIYLESQFLHTTPDCAKSGKKGFTGRETKFQANFFKVEKRPDWQLYKYHVDFNPAEDRTYMRKIFLREHREKLGMYLFDGSTIFSVHNLCPNKKPMELFSKRTSDEEKIRITIKRTKGDGTVEVSDYQSIQVMNIIFRECMKKMNLQLIKRNYFDKNGRIVIREHNLELWPGYITTIGQYEYDILLQAEIIYKTLRTDTAYDVFREIPEKAKSRSQSFKEAFTSAIIGCTVMTKYNDKTYRINDVSYSETPESTFIQKTKDGDRHIKYKDYYQQRYGVKINDLAQPLLISKTNARERRAGLPEFVSLVPELCYMTGLNDDMRNNYMLMREVAKYTSVAPSDRMRRLEVFKGRLMTIPEVKSKMNEWGVQLSEKLVEVKGRILPEEEIFFGNMKKFPSGPQTNWTHHLRSNALVLAAQLKAWVIIYPSNIMSDAKNLSDMIQKCGNGMKLHIPQPQPYAIANDGPSAYVNGIEEVINKYNPQMIVCVVPNNRSDRYAAIKKKTVLNKPVPSQVVLVKNIRAKGAMSIATKITIQINCKIGGVPWYVNIPPKNAMVVGFDVCHDTRDKRKSFGAMVASVNSTFGHYFSTVDLHSSGDELSCTFAGNITKAVNKYAEINEDRLPEPIIIYRDGVGDGDLKYVYDFEVEAIKEELTKIYQKKGVPLRLAVIIVTKRINTRIFHDRKNPPSGTIVDDIITNPHRFDFFIISQSVRQGTVQPVHYNVIYDSINWKADLYQRFTYKQCHLYFNWSGTVRVPAAVQYAHKLALLTSQCIGYEHPNLNRLLYFL